jgi:glucosylceramidase
MATTRREFIKLSAVGSASVGMSGAFVPGQSHSPSGDIAVWMTYGEKRFAPAPALRWSGAGGSQANTVQLDPGEKFQEILGFGAAFTDAACYMFHQLSESARRELLRELFHPSELGLSVCRMCMGSSDYSTKVYSYDEGEADPELKHFSIDHDREYMIPSMKMAQEMNPELFIFGSPWSPPGWMKFNESMLGGSMRRKYLPAYAQYFVKFVQAYEAAGVPIQAVTPQNEVDTDQDGRMPACIWPQEYEIEFVRDHLGPLFEKSGVKTRIWILDHNYNLWGRAICELDEPAIRKYSNAVAWHGYVGGAEMVSKVHEAHPDASMHWTEGGPDYTSPDYATDWAKWAQVFTGALRNWCRSITAWNFALDEQGRPNIGPFPCGGLVTINSQTREITRSGQFWAFAHYSRAIRRGAVRFASEGAIADLEHSAFLNPDGTSVTVLANLGEAKSVNVKLGGQGVRVDLPQSSLATLAWKS